MNNRSPFFKFAVFATAFVVILVCFLQHDNIFAWIKAGHTVSQQRRQIEQYKADIARLDEKLDAMSTDRDTLETYAREQFNFAGPGEDVYILEGEDSPRR